MFKKIISLFFCLFVSLFLGSSVALATSISLNPNSGAAHSILPSLAVGLLLALYYKYKKSRKELEKDQQQNKD